MAATKNLCAQVPGGSEFMEKAALEAVKQGGLREKDIDASSKLFIGQGNCIKTVDEKKKINKIIIEK